MPAMKHTSEAAFETVVEAHLLENGYVSIAGEDFDRERAIFPDAVFAFIRETQRDTATDTSCGARHQSYFVRKPHCSLP